MQDIMAKTSLAALAICFLITPSSTLFYTNSRENDYPRIGKRLNIDSLLDIQNARLLNALFSRLRAKEGDKALDTRPFLEADIDIKSTETDSAPIDDLRDAKITKNFNHRFSAENSHILRPNLLQALRKYIHKAERQDAQLRAMVKKLILRQKQGPEQDVLDIIEVMGNDRPSSSSKTIPNNILTDNDLEVPTYD